MESLFSLILDMSLTASFVIFAILLIRQLLKKAPKKYSYALWLVAAFRLICPVSVESAFSIFNLKFGKSGASLTDVPTYLPPTNIAPAQPAPSIAPSGSAAIVLPDAAPNIGTAQTVPIVPTEPAASVNMMGVLAIIWCLGIAALLIYSIYTYIKLKRRLSTAVLLQDNIRQASGIRSPFILGFIRPQIYVPYHLSDGEMDYVLAHERFHLKRRDHIIKPLAFLILVLHWFNPLVWLAFYLMVRDMEMSCDEKVLSRDESIRKDYSSTLLSFAAGRSFPAPSPLSFGEGSVKSRIKNILNWKKPALWLTVAAIVICAAVIAVCGTNARISLPADKISEVSANGETIPSEAAEELIYLINSHSKTAYHKAPAEVGNADSRVAITFEDGSSYYLHHWYCSGFSFNPAHFGEDDYYTILSRLDENGNPEKSWKMEYSFDKVFLDWLEKYSAGNLYPFGNEFTLSEAVFTRDNGVKLSFETAESILLDSSRTLYAGSEPLGTFEQITLIESNWDNYLTGASGTWLTYSAKELRRHNSRAWRIVSGDRYYYLLLQDDGTLYLAGGYYDAEGEYDSYSDDSNIFCVYELMGEGSGIIWHYIQYEQPDYFPLRFDFEYSSIRFIASEGRVRSADASGAIVSGIDIELTAEHSEIGWQPDIDANMNTSLRHEGDRENGAPVSEIFFTAALTDGSTLSGTIIVSRRDQRERYVFEITLQSETLSIKRNPDGGAVIYPASATSPAADVYAPISCIYMAPHSSYYAWGGDSGYRYIIGSDSITVERMDGSSNEVIPFADWNYSVLEPYSEEWTSRFIGNAPTFENISKPLYLQVSKDYFLLNLDGQLCIGEIRNGLVWDIYAIVPETQLGSAVWEYRPELSSHSPWFEFEFDMEYDNLQISTSVGTLFSDGSRYADTQLGLPYGSTVRWSPSAQYGRHSGTQLLFTVNFVDGSMMQGTIYISSENNLYTAVLRADGLYLSNDEDYGHGVITLTDLAAQDSDISSLIADKLRANFELGGSLYLTPYFAGQGKQETLLLTHRDDISGFIQNCQLSPVEAPSTEPSDYWIEISGIVSGTKITVWHGSSDTLKLTTEDGTQYYRVIGKSLAETLLQVYSGKTFLPFTSDLDELLNSWQAEGVTTLSEDQLEQLNKNFVPNIVGEGNPLSNFFICYYERPEEINLAAFLQYNSVTVSDYTEEDFYALKQQYPNHGQLFASDTYEDAKQYRNPIHKYTRESVDEQLMRYAGITTANLVANVDWENSGLVYLAEADAYFNFYSDMAAGAFTASSGEIVGDTVYLYNGFTTLTLRKSGDIWLIYSHTYDNDAATTAYLANSIIEIFDVGGTMDITEYANKSDSGIILTISDRSIAERYSNVMETFRFTKVDAPTEEPDVPRLEFTPTQPTNRLIIWDSETPLLRYSPRGRHEYYTFSSDVFDSLYDELYKSYDGLLQQKYLEENSTYTTDLNELLNKWQAEGVTVLSKEQCIQLTKNFIPISWNQNSSGIASTNPLNGFFSCYYERPEDIDLREFLRYNFDLDIGFTEEDFDLLRQHNVQIHDLTADETYEDAIRMMTPIHKYPRKKVDALLTKYAGITTADLSSEPNMVYLEEFSSYYNFTSDYGPLPFNCYAGKIDGDTVYLSDGSSTLTLRKNGDDWLFYSHIFYGSVELH